MYANTSGDISQIWYTTTTGAWNYGDLSQEGGAPPSGTLSCGAITLSPDPVKQGQSITFLVPVSASSGEQYSVSFAITGANINPYSDSVAAALYGSSYRATLGTSGQLGEYKVQTVIGSSGASYNCGNSKDFFNVITGTEPNQPGAAKCASMTGTWTDVASGQPNFVWSITNTGGNISGSVTTTGTCGEQIKWQAGGAYDSSSQTYKLTGANGNPATASCNGYTYATLDQIANGTIGAGSCGLGSGSFKAGIGIVSSPPGTVTTSGSNTFTVAERIPNGESSSVAQTSSTPSGWLDQYGSSTTAEFNASLSSPSGYNFGGRVVTETPGQR